jgi:hypothetical protein
LLHKIIIPVPIAQVIGTEKEKKIFPKMFCHMQNPRDL